MYLVRVYSLFFLIFHLIQFTVSVPYIFMNTYSFCNYEFSESGKVKKLKFSDELQTINTKNFIIYFSLCNSVQTKCKNLTSSCLIKKGSNQMTNLGNTFQVVDSEDRILESVKGDKCPNSNGNYKLTVNLQCSNSIKSKPRLLGLNDDDECNFEIGIRSPDCKPKCTDIVDDVHVIDLRNFPKNIPVTTDDNRRFSLTLCGSNRQCSSSDISSCEILNDSPPAALARIDSQSFVYSIDESKLIAKGRYREGRVIRELQVSIKCSWKTEMANATYIKVPNQGKRYRFELESSYGCVKLPHNCFVSSIGNLQYNLYRIYNPNGWKVANVPNGQIILNICGALKYHSKNICSEQYSQVCHEHNKNYINRGSILAPLEVINPDEIRATFSYGSSCKENPHLLYSTEIEFRCSAYEKGPVFKEYKDCVTLITWETPHACPVDYYKGQNCYMSDRVGHRNLQQLFSSTDKIYPLSQNNKKLMYNLCGPLHTPCNGYNNVSFCLKTQQNKEVVIGWDTRELISDNGFLKMELIGSTCLNRRTNGKVVVNFICNYENPPPPVKIQIIADDCQFNVTVYTPLACLAKEQFGDCTLNVGESCYDLSPLSNKNRNYVIKDENTELIFNVCGPIISGPGALCRGNTMSCMRNKTEININRQFKSLGGVSVPVIYNDSLIIESTMGAYCEELGHYRTVIHFECSQKKTSPKFLSKEPCAYHLIWKTPEACSKRRNCIIGNSSRALLDLTDLKERSLKISIDNGTNSYEFHLCKDYYTRFIENVATTDVLKREVFYKDDEKYLSLDLKQSCDSSNIISKIKFEFECYETENNIFEQKYFNNCILNMVVKTRIVCKTKEVRYFYKTEKKVLDQEGAPKLQQTTAKAEREKVVPQMQMYEHKDCSIFNNNTGKEYKLSNLKSKKILFENSSYVLNFDGNLKDCPGILCNGSINMIPSNQICPYSVVKDIDKQVEFEYLTQIPCRQHEYYKVEFWLKCNQTVTHEKITRRGICKLIVVYDKPEICYLFHESMNPTPAIVGGVTTVIILLIIAGLCYVYRKKCYRFHYSNISCDSKSAVPIYIRNCRE